MSWGLAIDYGTSFTAGAVYHEGGVEVVEVEDSPRFPSAILVAEDGSLLTGRAASNQARRHPERYERAPKRLVGQPAALLGERAIDVGDMVGAVLRRMGDAAKSRQGSAQPGWVRLTHPAGWGRERQDVLRGAARLAGLGEVELLSEPEAAAWFFVADRRGEEPVVEPGGCVAVYDLGGGTFDTAILRRSAAGFELAGPPGGLDWFGGEDFDQRLFDLVLGRVRDLDEPASRWLGGPEGAQAARARMQLREDVRKAKEALSFTDRVVVPVLTEGDDVLDVAVTRQDFERLIGEDLARTVVVLDKTARAAGVGPEEITAVYLTGGSSRIPMVGTLAAHFHPRVFTRPDPKTLVVRGAITARFPPQPAAADLPAPPPEVAATPIPAAAAAESPAPAASQPPRPKRTPPARERLRQLLPQSDRGRIAAAAGVVLVAVIAVALLAGSSGPSLEVSSRTYVDGPQNVARLAGTAEPGDALVAAGGRRTRARDGRWSLRVRPSRAGEVRLRASEDGETAATTVVVPGPRLAGTWRVVQTDVLANAVIGGRVRGARAIWSFRALCSEGRCWGAVLAFPSPTGATRIRLRRRGKVFTGTRSYTLPRSGSCARTAVRQPLDHAHQAGDHALPSAAGGADRNPLHGLGAAPQPAAGWAPLRRWAPRDTPASPSGMIGSAMRRPYRRCMSTSSRCDGPGRGSNGARSSTSPIRLLAPHTGVRLA